jgi:hypothetical protein
MRITAAALLLLCAPTLAQDGKPAPPQARVLQADGGRFVFGQISDFRRDQFMLDTKTGRLWRVVTSTVGEPGKQQDVYLLEHVLYVGPDNKWITEPPPGR